MRTRFNFDSTGATVAIAILTPGALMTAIGLLGFKSGYELAMSLIVGISVLFILWFGFAKGTYVSIDENGVLSSTLFFFTRVFIPLKQAVELRTRDTFMGGVTELHLLLREENGLIKDKVFGSRQAFKKKDFKQLIETISLANPAIKISSDLFKK